MTRAHPVLNGVLDIRNVPIAEQPDRILQIGNAAMPVPAHVLSVTGRAVVDEQVGTAFG
jgi:hypothetical protein